MTDIKRYQETSVVMYQEQQQLFYGVITAYGQGSGTVTSRFEDGRYYSFPFLREHVYPALPPPLDLCVDLQVQYNLHCPFQGKSHAFNVHVLTPLPWIPPRHAAPHVAASISYPPQCQPDRVLQTYSASHNSSMASKFAPIIYKPLQASKAAQSTDYGAAPVTSTKVVGASLPARLPGTTALAAATRVPLPDSPRYILSKEAKDGGKASGENDVFCKRSEGKAASRSASDDRAPRTAKQADIAIQQHPRRRGWWPEALATGSSTFDAVDSAAQHGSGWVGSSSNNRNQEQPFPATDETTCRQLIPQPATAQAVQPQIAFSSAASLSNALAPMQPALLPFPPPPLYPAPPSIPSRTTSDGHSGPPLPAYPPPPPPPLPPGSPPPMSPVVPLPPPPPLLAAEPRLPPAPLPSSGTTVATAPRGSCTGLSCQGPERQNASTVMAAAQSREQSKIAPQYATQPPVPYAQFNLPYIDRAAQQPMPTNRSRWGDTHMRQETRNQDQHHRSHAREHGHDDRRHDRDRKRYYANDHRERYRPDRGFGRVDRRDVRDYDSSVSHRAQPRHWDMSTVHMRRRAADMAAAHVRHRRRSITASLLGDAATAADSQKDTRIQSKSSNGRETRVESGEQARTVAEAKAAAEAALSKANSAGNYCTPPINLVTSSSDTCGETLSDQSNSHLSDSLLAGNTTKLSGQPGSDIDTDDGDDDDELKKAEVPKDVPGNRCTRKAGASRASRSKSGKSMGARGSRRAPKDVIEELERAIARVSLEVKPLPHASEIRLFCGHCGKEQAWDLAGERARPLPDPSAPGGIKRTKDAGRVLYESKESKCFACGNLIMCNPLSATCIYCDCQMDGFRPTYWKCINVDGTARKRVLARAPTSRAAASGPGTDAQVNKPGVQAASTSSTSTGAAEATSDTPKGCPYSRTCTECFNHDLRYRGRPRCNCPRLHGAVAGQITGNRAGNLGWVNVH